MSNEIAEAILTAAVFKEMMKDRRTMLDQPDDPHVEKDVNYDTLLKDAHQIAISLKGWEN